MGNTPAGAPAFIHSVITNLNSGATGGQTFENDISTDENASELQLSEQVTGTLCSISRSLRYAIARWPLTLPVCACSSACSRSHPPSTQFSHLPPTGPRARQGRGDHPVAGHPGRGDLDHPLFCAAPRIDTTTQKHETPRPTRTMCARPYTTRAGQETSAFFGCSLDINQASQPLFPLNPSPADGPFTGGGLQTIQQLVRNSHQCLVAEIAFDPDPIPNGSSPPLIRQAGPTQSFDCGIG